MEFEAGASTVIDFPKSDFHSDSWWLKSVSRRPLEFFGLALISLSYSAIRIFDFGFWILDFRNNPKFKIENGVGGNDGTRTRDDLIDNQAHWPLCYIPERILGFGF